MVFHSRSDHIADDLDMHLGITYHAFFTDLLPACLKLRLDQAYHSASFFSKGYAAGSILEREINETSTEAKSISSGICSFVT